MAGSRSIPALSRLLWPRRPGTPSRPIKCDRWYSRERQRFLMRSKQDRSSSDKRGNCRDRAFRVTQNQIRPAAQIPKPIPLAKNERGRLGQQPPRFAQGARPAINLPQNAQQQGTSRQASPGPQPNQTAQPPTAQPGPNQKRLGGTQQGLTREQQAQQAQQQAQQRQAQRNQQQQQSQQQAAQRAQQQQAAQRAQQQQAAQRAQQQQAAQRAQQQQAPQRAQQQRGQLQGLYGQAHGPSPAAHAPGPAPHGPAPAPGPRPGGNPNAGGQRQHH